MSGRKDMDILKQARKILVQRNLQEKNNLLAQLSQVLEHHHELNEADIVEECDSCYLPHYKKTIKQ